MWNQNTVFKSLKNALWMCTVETHSSVMCVLVEMFNVLFQMSSDCVLQVGETVCSTSDKTYSSLCHARCDSAIIKAKGPCHDFSGMTPGATPLANFTSPDAEPVSPDAEPVSPDAEPASPDSESTTPDASPPSDEQNSPDDVEVLDESTMPDDAALPEDLALPDESLQLDESESLDA